MYVGRWAGAIIVGGVRWHWADDVGQIGGSNDARDPYIQTTRADVWGATVKGKVGGSK